MEATVKQELIDFLTHPIRSHNAVPLVPVSVIDLSSSDSDSDSDSDESDQMEDSKRPRVLDGIDGRASVKKARMDELGVVLPVGFLNCVSPEDSPAVCPPLLPAAEVRTEGSVNAVVAKGSKQFWKAGDYEGSPGGDWDKISGGMDRVRVHPKFLHSNATSHKWALGAFAELLDNSLDEVCNGATFVNIDMHENKKDGSKMITIEDNGGGMDPEKMRQCLSLGYSAKSKIANTIGQYGNGFKTSTMRLGADVIVFSRCSGTDGKSPSQSIGLLSYTFLRSTGKEDIVVPMLDYERQERGWAKLVRYSVDWNKNVDTIVQWSPFSSEADLLRQFNLMKDHGTRVIIYNLWENDQGLLELDFDTDPHDIQLRGVNREEKNIQMANQYPNSRHFLTYRHSLRSYASILYLRLPPSFRIILRGKDVEHHNIVNDMMLSQEKSYRPQAVPDGAEKDVNMTAVVTIGFVKDAKHHIDVQGFNVYHKNRLIKPFWRLWNATGSDGRGVIGILEANFVEPAHDKQGFERTTVLARLEAKLVQMQKTYWSTLCHKIGYAPRRNKKFINGSADTEPSPDYLLLKSSHSKSKSNASSIKTSLPGSDKFFSSSNQKHGMDNDSQRKSTTKSGKRPISVDRSSSSDEDVSDNEAAQPRRRASGNSHKTIPAQESFGKDGLHRNWSSSYLEETESPKDCATGGRSKLPEQRSQLKGKGMNTNGCPPSHPDLHTLEQLQEENRKLKERFNKQEGGEVLSRLLQDLQYERDRCKSLGIQLEELQRRADDLNREQESLIDIFSEERERRDLEEEQLRKKLKEASNTIQELQEKARLIGR